jgi:hypothetical protein
MKTTAQTTFAERVGRTLGRLWRGCVRLDRRATHRLVAKGWGPGVAQILLLLVKLAAFGVLLYAAFWLALLLLCIVVVAWMARQQDSEDDSDLLGRKAEERDHREGPFYHPVSHDDDPDPRFNDD